MKFQWTAAFLIVAATITQTSSVPGVEQDHPLQLTVAPLVVRLSAGEKLPSGSRIELQSMDPQGNLHAVRDLQGQGQWSLETLRDGRNFQIIPSPASYAGPLQVKVDGRVISRYGEMIPSSKNLVLEKVLSARAANGTLLKVHFTDFTLEKSDDRTYPHRVLTHMQKAYDVLTRDMKLGQNPDARPKVIEAYIGDTEAGGLLPFGGFELEDFRRAPLFMIRTNEATGEKTPALLLPANYKKFLEFWNRINRVPENAAGNTYTDDQYLATSVMHEMTHAIVHGFNENLGSTEHEIRGGDWYTEGLARYFECKSGSDAGFASEGFRKIVDGRVQFSRGGANYYLRYPDESFFTMRYENALFWMYFDKRFGPDAIVQVSRDLRLLEQGAGPGDFARVLSEVTGERFDDLLNDYFNWTYRGEYGSHPEGTKLQTAAVTRSVWSDGQFYIYNARGTLTQFAPVLKTDWVSAWGTATAAKTTENIAGDWTREADIQPLAFDAHQILMSAGPGRAQNVRIANTGSSEKLRVTLYLESREGIRTQTLDIAAGQTGRADLSAYERVTRVGAVLANLDMTRPAAYQITIE